MRNPLLVFFSGYSLNRYYIRLKFPRDIAVITTLNKEVSLRAGTCAWRGLYSGWSLNSGATTLLNFSQVKQYRLGFDSALPALKAPSELRRLKHVRFNIDYRKLVSSSIFSGFYFNIGAYNTTSNHSLALWCSVYKQLIKLSTTLHLIRGKAHGVTTTSQRNVEWRRLWPQDMLVWSLSVARKMQAVRQSSYLDDTSLERYNATYSSGMPWEYLKVTGALSDNLLVGALDVGYVLPEFYNNREVMSSTSPERKFGDGVNTEFPYSEAGVIASLEGSFYTLPEVFHLNRYSARSGTYLTYVLYLALSSAN